MPKAPVYNTIWDTTLTSTQRTVVAEQRDDRNRVFITRRGAVTGNPDEKCHATYETCAASIEISGNRIANKTFYVTKFRIALQNVSGNRIALQNVFVT